MIVEHRYQSGDPLTRQPSGHHAKPLNMARMTTIIRDSFDESVYHLTAAIIRQAAIDHVNGYEETKDEHPAYAFLSHAGYLEVAPTLANMARYIISD